MAKAPQQPNPWRMAHMGLEFAGAALLLGLVGYYIDTQAGTAPWGAAIGLLVGVVGGMYRFIKEALAANRQFSKPTRDRNRDAEHQTKQSPKHPPDSPRNSPRNSPPESSPKEPRQQSASRPTDADADRDDASHDDRRRPQ